jgi:peptide-methionine (S)-S-oxide reductase
MNNGEFATFGGGSFWYIDAIFRKIKGVENVISGYSGGHISSPTYKDICSGTTGHALVVQIIYQPSIISYQELLQIFFASHDPTTLNAQGPDKGTHYRSIILFHNDEQLKTAEEFIIKIKDQYLNPITTDLVEFKQFYTAEPMHQNFYKFNRESGYSIFVIEPKLKFIKRLFPNMSKDIIFDY